jgi:hypothetical protein
MVFGDAEGPAAAVDVAAVLPDGLEAGFEEVEGLAHLHLLDGGVVGVAPEVLDGLDLVAELLEIGRVGLAVALRVVGLVSIVPSWYEWLANPDVLEQVW